MSRFELTRSALADVDELWTDIAEDNAEAADRVTGSNFFCSAGFMRRCAASAVRLARARDAA
jgi:hypothetical protein